MKIQGKLASTGKPTELIITDHRIQTLRETDADANGVWIAPALIDIQVNGFAGRSFNATDVTPDDVGYIVRSLWAVGTGFLCPTVTTGSFERMANSIRAIVAACDDAAIERSVVGIHVEGPYISPEDGPRGAHDRAQVRKPDWDEFQRWQELAEGRICMVTLAPELDGAIPFIEKATEAGVIVALGHTNAEKQDIDAAIQAGARLSTHLGNGSHALIRRHPNYIWEQLAADALWASLIVDGHHLPPSVVKCMLRAKGLERCILTSDAVRFAGMQPGIYGEGHRQVELTAARRVNLLGTNYLAGSAIELVRGVENSVRFAGIRLSQAIDLATAQPAKLLGLENQIGVIAQNAPANLITFRWDAPKCQITLLSTVLNGEVVYRRA